MVKNKIPFTFPQAQLPIANSFFYVYIFVGPCIIPSGKMNREIECSQEPLHLTTSFAK